MYEPVVYMLIGFFIGGIVGGALASKQKSREYDERIEELTDENARLKVEAHKKREARIADAEKKLAADDRKIDFVKLSNAYKSPEFDRHFATRAHPEDDIPDEGEDLDDDPDNIYLISEQEYLHDLGKRSGETLRYYQEDGVLTDANGEPIRNQVDVIGVECMEEIEGTSKDVLYVANDIFDISYMIHVDHEKSYYADIMGV